MNDIQLQAMAFAYGISEETLRGICAALEHSGWHPPQPISTEESTVVISNDKPIQVPENTEDIDLSPFELVIPVSTELSHSSVFVPRLSISIKALRVLLKKHSLQASFSILGSFQFMALDSSTTAYITLR